MSAQNKTAGFVIALIAAGLALIAFFALPFMALGPFSFSAEQLANFAAQYSQSSSYYSQSASSSTPSSILLLWFAPVIAGGIILLGAFQFRNAATVSNLRLAAGLSIAAAIAGLLLYGGVYLYLNQYNSDYISITSLLGSGFWLYVLGMLGALAGGIMVLTSNPAQPAGPGAPRPPDQSYPQNPPQYPPYPPSY